MTRALLVAGILTVLAVAFYIHQRNPTGTVETIDRVLIEKSIRRLSIFRSGRLIQSYRVALGHNPLGSKEQEGDGRTPEGLYTIDLCNAASDYHRALHLSYPSPEDRARAITRGVDPGCDVEIHGLPNGFDSYKLHPGTDWTAGCIAVTNEEIEELFRITPQGTTVEIRP